jgi:hypothetical protein
VIVCQALQRPACAGCSLVCGGRQCACMRACVYVCVCVCVHVSITGVMSSPGTTHGLAQPLRSSSRSHRSPAVGQVAKWWAPQAWQLHLGGMLLCSSRFVTWRGHRACAWIGKGSSQVCCLTACSFWIQKKGDDGLCGCLSAC